MKLLQKLHDWTPSTVLLAAFCIASAILTIALLGMQGIVASILFLPILLILLGQHGHSAATPHMTATPDRLTALSGQISEFLGRPDNPTVLLLLETDGFDRLEELHESTLIKRIMSFIEGAIATTLAGDDMALALDHGKIAVALAPDEPLDLEMMLNLCTRIQHTVSHHSFAGEISTSLTVSIGFAASDQLSQPTAEALLRAAQLALAEARRNGPSAVRGFSQVMAEKQKHEKDIGQDAARALDQGEIFAFFQPQVCLQSGVLTGFEALARWHHPHRGVVSPADFLPAMERNGLMNALGMSILKDAMNALNFWDRSGFIVPRIGVNFSMSELRDPRLTDRIAMILDAAEISPHRLSIEVLETVIANNSDDEIIANLAALADLGCQIDLDDFGTGYASITNIRRFSVGRIKIDRSFVSGLDRDPEQRDMVGAILTMAERLEVETLAEGIETSAEQAALAKLGCGAGQGFAIGRPMPLEETIDWLEVHHQPSIATQHIGRRTG